jgi:hypothetical protein
MRIGRYKAEFCGEELLARRCTPKLAQHPLSADAIASPQSSVPTDHTNDPQPEETPCPRVSGGTYEWYLLTRDKKTDQTVRSLKSPHKVSK